MIAVRPYRRSMSRDCRASPRPGGFRTDIPAAPGRACPPAPRQSGFACARPCPGWNALLPRNVSAPIPRDWQPTPPQAPANPLQRRPMSHSALRSGGQILVEQLKIQGCDRIFTVPGESFLAVLDALHDAPEIETIVCRQEGGVSYMADADGKMTGKPGV